ncbi:5'-nucleotidase SurE [Bacteroidia bacterium]|nr:5'-nucleotidase SurE [Bacteroidia bacterium]
MSSPLILLTNDDGIRAKGLRALVEIARPFGKLVLVAPEEVQSGQSHAITSHLPLRIRKIDPYDKDVEAYACTGTPVDCVKLCMSHLLHGGVPDVVLSGINHGSNSSSSILYSGTVAAAQEGALYGAQALAFSLLNLSADADFSNCIGVGQQILEKALRTPMRKDTLLTVNIPDVPGSQLKGIKVMRQAQGMWVERYDRRIDPHNNDYFWLTGDYVNKEPDATDTDEWALANNYVSITPIQADMTSYNDIPVLQQVFNSEKL